MRKTDESPVTVADREIEHTLRQAIHERYPHHGIIGEEYGSTPGKSSWVLDPIDGTASFIAGNPLFGTLIGFLRSDEPFIGLIDIPVMGERRTGDGKCFMPGNSGRTVAVSAGQYVRIARPSTAVYCTAKFIARGRAGCD